MLSMYASIKKGDHTWNKHQAAGSKPENPPAPLGHHNLSHHDNSYKKDSQINR
jgi:hypothetical protein